MESIGGDKYVNHNKSPLKCINAVLEPQGCLLYTSDAADEEDSVDLGGSRIIKKKKKIDINTGR